MQALVATLRCPISGGIMQDPVILRCSGVSYERSVLDAWIEVEGTDPGTGEPLEDVRVVDNPCFKSLIQAVVARLNLGV